MTVETPTPPKALTDLARVFADREDWSATHRYWPERKEAVLFKTGDRRGEVRYDAKDGVRHYLDVVNKKLGLGFLASWLQDSETGKTSFDLARAVDPRFGVEEVGGWRVVSTGRAFTPSVNVLKGLVKGWFA